MSEEFELNAASDTAQRREHSDPTERNSPIPKLVLGITALACTFGAAYILVQQREDPPGLGDTRSLATLATQPRSTSSAADGAQLFGAHCAACHQATGAGLPGVFPPLAKSEWVNGSASRLAKIVLHGITGGVTVMGQVYNGQMPAFREKLSDAELAALLSHVRSQFGNASAPVDAAVVKAARDATAGRTAPWNGDHDLSTLD